MQIKGAIFDLDGVILQGEFFSDRFEKEYGVPADKIVAVLKGEVIKAKSQNIPTFKIWEKYLIEWGVNLSEEEFFNFWFQGDEVNDEVLAIVKAVAKKVEHIVVLSDNFQERVDWLKKTFDFWNIFEKVYFSSEIGYSKDTEAAFQVVLGDFRLKAEEVFYVDDSSTAIKVAQEIGINAHQYKNLDGLKEALEQNNIEI